MWPVSQQFQDALTTSHTVIQRADVYYGGTLRAEGVPVMSGSVTVDRNSKVRRTCQVTLATDERVDSTESMYLPNGGEIVLYRGIDFGPTEELVPLGVFRIDTLNVQQPAGTISLQGSDRSVMVQDDKFIAPEAASGQSVKDEIIRLVTSSIAGGVTVVDNMPSYDLPMQPDVVWEQERWDAIESLADSLNASVFFDQIGRLEIIQVPVATDTPVKAITAGDVVINKTTNMSRLATFNALVLTGDQVGDEDIRSVAYDTDPTSPTFWDGPFGHRPKFFRSTFITTQTDADHTAAEMLARETALPRKVTFTMIPDPSLEGGDVVEITFTNGVTERHMIDTIQIGLAASDAMTVQTTSLTHIGGTP